MWECKNRIDNVNRKLENVNKILKELYRHIVSTGRETDIKFNKARKKA
ncbi:hypothetical protein Hs30E_06260 [Lactococcus hodotermopsidis]|uniref:Uncharacterized protein n=1 Tax=Pseudolactococcus hodotermopsidis TaxID=2709157 RepID=A0A6A0BBP0_9LACT|nr:hypothetical protein Hs30E_06260 [Lactococcus hodotermopsidis]